MSSNTTTLGQCSCGAVKVEVIGSPMFRAYCHCSLCQKFNNAAYADVSVFKAKNVAPFDESDIDFKPYKKPPLVQRGTCIHCGQAAVEKVAIPLMPKLTVVPSGMFSDHAKLPDSSMHMFYETRVEDVDDNVKKYNGFMSSQMAFSSKLFKALLFGSK